jgi:hypothetical protein
MLEADDLRWELLQAALRRNWGYYHELVERINTLRTPGAPDLIWCCCPSCRQKRDFTAPPLTSDGEPMPF